MKHALKPSHFFRTAYFIGWLKQNTGQGHVALEKRIRLNQYEKFGLKAPAADTVRDYFRLRRSPAIDPQDGMTPPWLMAVELEIPGSSYAFFHPLFDFLIVQMESSQKWLERLEKIPEGWIHEAIKRGNINMAEEWRSFNEASLKKRGRKPRQPRLHALNFIHMTMMRLPAPIFPVLFAWSDREKLFARTYLPIDQEIESIKGFPSMDALAALVGLVFEAAEIGNTDRFHRSKKALRDHLCILDEVPEFQYVRAELKWLVKSFCLAVPVRMYASPQFYGYGLPATWRSKNTIDQLKADLEQFVTSVFSNE